jgi:sulfite reductase (ferredoxin)
MHFVELTKVPEVMRHLASVGLTTREACGDTVRNVMACHLAGACPYEKLDVTPWAEATFEHFVRNPIGQRLPRKFKINFSGCNTDCGQAMFNDVGVVAAARTLDDGTIEQGFKVYLAGGLGANPHPAIPLEDFTTREELLPTIEAVLRVFDQTGNRDNKLRARLKWVVDTLGADELRERILKQRHLLPASSSWPGGIPEIVAKAGDEPAGMASTGEVSAVGQGVRVDVVPHDPYQRWVATSVVRGEAKGTISAVAYAALGDITADQFRSLASIQRELGADVRLSNRQNVVFRGLTESQIEVLYQRLEAIGMARPGAELARDVVACPGADTCNIAVTQSRGLAKAIGEQLEEEGLAEVGGVRINISGCTNSCGQHHAADIGFFGAERRAHGQSAPGYQMLLGGYVGQETIHFGDKALRLPAKAAPEAAARVVRRFAAEREAGEAFRGWMDRAGGAKAIAAELKDLDWFPTPEEGPEFFVDFDETGPFTAEVGDSECAV